MNLYIVTTGLPGPDPAECGFVELEDESGASVGPSTTGADWHPVPGADLYRLGPFLSASGVSAAEAIVRALAALPDAEAVARTRMRAGSCAAREARHSARFVELRRAQRTSTDCPWRMAVEWVAANRPPFA